MALRDLLRRDLLPYHAYRAGAAVARAVPFPVGLALAAGGARVAARIPSARRAMVERHQERVAGRPLDAAERRRVVVEAFDSYGRYWFESFRLPGTPPEQLDAHMTTEGIEHVDAALAAGRGAIVALPHLGGWDFGGAWMCAVKHYPSTVVVEEIRPAELFSWFVTLRRSLGMTVVPVGARAGSVIISALKRNEVVGLVTDRDISGGGVEVDFFGERTTMPGGPATLALRTGAALIPAAIYFGAGRHHHGVVLPEISQERTGTLREDVARITQDMAHAFEDLIRRAPTQWHLFQPNWPSDRL